MAKKTKGKPMMKFWAFLMWLLAIIIALAVGVSMINGTLAISFLPAIVAIVAGWIVVILTFLGIIMAIFNWLM
jgi:hypothetical protein